MFPLKCCCVWSQLTVMVQDRKSCPGQYVHNNNLWLDGLLREAATLARISFTENFEASSDTNHAMELFRGEGGGGEAGGERL